MTADKSTSKRESSSPIEPISSMARWTLGNLDHAFDQALDEAFRTCSSIFNELEQRTLESPRHGDASCASIERHSAERFGSCDGPVADGELGEGSGGASIVAA